MSKWYEVTLLAREVVLIEVNDSDDEDKAVSEAFDESSFSFVSDKEAQKIVLIEGNDKLESAKNHADYISPLPK